MFVFEQDKKLKINTIDNDPAKANIVIESTEDGKAKITMDGQELGPGGGSAIVVEFGMDLSSGEPTIICDKTPEEVIALSAESPVCGLLKVEGVGQPLGVFTQIITAVGEGRFYSPLYGFAPFIGGDKNGKFMVGITSDGEWEFNAM